MLTPVPWCGRHRTHAHRDIHFNLALSVVAAVNLSALFGLNRQHNRQRKASGRRGGGVDMLLALTLRTMGKTG